MNVQRIIPLTRIEPQPLSMRVPAGMPVTLDLRYLTANGSAPHTSDIAAQLVLTGRSSNRGTSYAVPSTDIVNGRARASIPSGDLTDANGYRMALYGTVDSQMQLVALGVCDLLQAAGPEPVAADVIDQIDLVFFYGSDVVVDVKLWQDAGKGAPYDIGAPTVSAVVRESRDGITLVPFTVVETPPNIATLSLTAAQVDTLPAACWWSLAVATDAGVTMLAEGTVTVRAS